MVGANLLSKSYAAMKIQVMRAPHRLCAVGLIAFAIVLFVCSVSSCQRSQFSGGLTKLKPCRLRGLDEELLCGKFTVFENRETRTGRTIDLNVVVLPALDPTHKRNRYSIWRVAREWPRPMARSSTRKKAKNIGAIATSSWWINEAREIQIR